VVAPPPRPSFAEAFRFWLKLGFISFGGPSGQIALMHAELVERKKWIDEGRFLHALNFCMLLPGPEAQQLATYVGWLMHKTAGGIAAGTLFVLPSAFILWGLSWIYLSFGEVPSIAAAFYGLQIAVMAVVAQSVIRIGQKVLKNAAMWALAGAAFLALAVLHAPFPLIIIGAGITGFVGGRLRPELFAILDGHGAATDSAAAAAYHFETPSPSWGRSLKVLLIGLAVWFAPVIGVGWWLGRDHAVFQMGVFFSKAASVTFGGAYAVLPYVAQQAVERFGWLSTNQMLVGLGLAESTPGPLIMVLQFVGFVGGWQHPGGLTPLAAATIGAAITTWCTFVPCFLWIFLGGPSVERLRGNQLLSAALSAITAAVVGVILNLAVWFAWHVILPAPERWDGFAIVVGLAAFAGLQWRKWNVVYTILACAAIGVVWRLLY
jgi:chromate transporter